MPGQRGQDLLLKDGTGTAAATIGAMRNTGFTLNGQAVEATNKDSAGMWRELVASAGVVSLDISAEGVLVAGSHAQLATSRAIARSNDNYTLVFDNGDNFAGPFRMVTFEAAGPHDGEQTYRMALQSAGSISFTTA